MSLSHTEKFKYTPFDKSIMSVVEIKKYIPKFGKSRWHRTSKEKYSPPEENEKMNLLMAFENSIYWGNFTEAYHYEKMLDERLAKEKIPN